MASDRRPSRWWIAAAAFVVMFPLGGIYAWSVFVEPLQQQFDWSWTQAMTPLMTNVGLIFVGTLAGGWIQDRTGPKRVAAIGVVIYSAGVAAASLARSEDQLWLLTLTYGVVGGLGVGVAYVTAPAMITKWFPDQRGLAAGIATLGFGAGALLTAPLGEWLVESFGEVAPAFWVLAIVYVVIGLPFCLAFKDPPEDWEQPEVPDSIKRMQEMRQYTLQDALRTFAFWALTLMLFVNVTIGIALVTMADPVTQDITGVGSGAAAALVAILGIFNGLGRPGVAWLSDSLGRTRTYLAMFVLQAACFALLPIAEQIVLFGVLACVIAFCFGGGFGLTPAATVDYFGTEHNGAIVGATIVAWSAGGVVGPLVISELRDATDSFAVPLWLFAGVSLLAALLPLVTKPPKDRRPDEGAKPKRSGSRA
jgi:MFS transporter, OFA family, oxalate/formate antiporter